MKGSPSKKGNFGRPCQFIEKLLQMMKNHPKCVMWAQKGELLRFTKLEEFQNQILPSYFRHRNLLSFVRQLNMYYFSKCETPDSSHMLFRHEIFQEGKESQFRKIVRRNRFRDEVYCSMRENLPQTMDLIKKENNLSVELKEILTTGIEHHQILLKAAEKVKVGIQDIGEKLKNTRCKDAKQIKDNLLASTVPVLQQQMEELAKVYLFIKNCLCRDIKPVAQNPLSLFASSYFHEEDKHQKGITSFFNNKSLDSLAVEKIPIFNSKCQEEDGHEDDAVSLEQDFNSNSEEFDEGAIHSINLNNEATIPPAI